MRYIINVFSLFLGFIVFSSLTSCTVLLPSRVPMVTHDSVMQSYKNKSQVISKFGVPSVKTNFEGLEIWIYDLGTVQSSEVVVRNYPESDKLTESYVTETYEKFVEFHFRGDEVINYRTEGVDYSTLNKKIMRGALGFMIDSVIVSLALGGFILLY